MLVRPAGGAPGRRPLRSGLSALIVAAGLTLAPFAAPSAVWAGSSAAPAAQISAETQRNVGGQVTVDVAWRGSSAEPAFAVVLDTHAVNLDQYDLSQLAVLRTDQGQEVRPSGWDAPPGGHHREGTLAFPGTSADGASVIGPSVRAIELVIRNVAGVPERVFRWTLET